MNDRNKATLTLGGLLLTPWLILAFLLLLMIAFVAYIQHHRNIQNQKPVRVQSMPIHMVIGAPQKLGPQRDAPEIQGTEWWYKQPVTKTTEPGTVVIQWEQPAQPVEGYIIKFFTNVDHQTLRQMKEFEVLNNRYAFTNLHAGNYTITVCTIGRTGLQSDPAGPLNISITK